MGRTLDAVMADLSADRRQAIEARTAELLREYVIPKPPAAARLTETPIDPNWMRGSKVGRNGVVRKKSKRPK